MVRRGGVGGGVGGGGGCALDSPLSLSLHQVVIDRKEVRVFNDAKDTYIPSHYSQLHIN